MNNSPRALSSIEVFSGLDEQSREEIMSRCMWRDYAAGERIIMHGDKTTDVYFVTQGSVRASIFSENGREVAFHDLAAGSMFGELAAFDQLPRSTYVLTLTDVSLAVLSREDFLEVLSLHPAAMAAVLIHLSGLWRVRLLRSCSAILSRMD